MDINMIANDQGQVAVASEVFERGSLSDHRLTQPVEYQSSTEFEHHDASDTILAPTPGLDDDLIYGLVEPESVPYPAGTPAKMRYLYHVDLLTTDQERHLFRKMNYLKFLAEKLRQKILASPDRIDFQDRFHTKLNDAKKIRDYIISANLRLVVSIAKSLTDRQQNLDDLIGYGHQPLIRAAEIFDYERGNRFSTYATWAVRNHLLRILKKQQKQDSFVKTTEELPVVIDHSHEDLKLPFEEKSQRALLQLLMSEMPKRDQYILKHRYGLKDNAKPQSFRQLGETLGVSTERVRQLHNRIIERLHESFKTEGYV